MKVAVDAGKCAAHGRCYAVASEFYDVDDDGFNVMDGVEVPTGLEQKARDGAAACPEQAITIID